MERTDVGEVVRRAGQVCKEEGGQSKKKGGGSRMRGENASLRTQLEQFSFFPEQSDISFSVFEVSEKKEARRGGHNGGRREREPRMTAWLGDRLQGARR